MHIAVAGHRFCAVHACPGQGCNEGKSTSHPLCSTCCVCTLKAELARPTHETAAGGGIPQVAEAGFEGRGSGAGSGAGFGSGGGMNLTGKYEAKSNILAPKSFVALNPAFAHGEGC